MIKAVKILSGIKCFRNLLRNSSGKVSVYVTRGVLRVFPGMKHKLKQLFFAAVEVDAVEQL